MSTALAHIRHKNAGNDFSLTDIRLSEEDDPEGGIWSLNRQPWRGPAFERDFGPGVGNLTTITQEVARGHVLVLNWLV